MDREELEHAIRAACEVAEDDELFVFGSQAILGQYPDAADTLRASVELDVQPKNRPETVDRIDGALGEFSPFHSAYGFYVHGVSIESAYLPRGWERRTVRVRAPGQRRTAIGYCVEAHDLAASKLAAYRDKDLDFVTTLLVEELVSPSVLVDRIESLPVDAETRRRSLSWMEGTARALGLG